MPNPTSAKCQQTPSTPKSENVRGWKRFWFRVIAILLGLLPFILLEFVLILFDIGEPTQYDDPFVGFSSIHPLFIFNKESGKYETAPSRREFFSKQQFPAVKPKNEFRIFCLGGSTVRGRPHDTDTAFPKWLEIELVGQSPSHTYRIVNAGGVSYASYRLRPILSEVLQYDPNLIILATGHNEFLEDRTYQNLKYRPVAEKWILDRAHSLRSVTLLRRLFSTKRTVLSRDIEAKLDQIGGYISYHRDEKWWDSVTEHYRVSVETMVRLCRKKKVPLLLVNLGSNLRDCPPFKYEHKLGLPAEDHIAWRKAFELGKEEELRAMNSPVPCEGTLHRALAFYRKAERLDDQYGLLLFRIARCLDRLGKHQEARNYYFKAKEQDVCPLRMRKRLHQILRKVAAKYQAPFVDVQKLLSEQAEHNTPGFDVYVDHVHPTIASHQRIAQRLFAEMIEKKLVKSVKLWSKKERREAYSAHLRKLPPAYRPMAKKRIQWVENWARRFELEECLYLEAHERVRLGYRHLEIDRTQEASNAFRSALHENPMLEKELLDASLRYFHQGQMDQARQILNCLVQHPATTKNRKNHYLAGFIFALEQKNKREALKFYDLFEKAVPAAASLGNSWSDLKKQALRHQWLKEQAVHWQ